MRKTLMFFLIFFSILLFSGTAVLAEATAPQDTQQKSDYTDVFQSLTDDQEIFARPSQKVRDEIRNFNLKDFSQSMKNWAIQAYEVIRNSSDLYIVIVVVLTAIFLLLGPFSKFFRKMAVYVLLAGGAGYLLLMFFPDILSRILN